MTTSDPLLSDPDLRVIDAYELRNPEEGDLAFQAVFVVGINGRVSYRKIARRRVGAQELEFALDGVPTRCCPGDCDDPRCEPIEWRGRSVLVRPDAPMSGLSSRSAPVMSDSELAVG